jgi:hypothetical protein
MNEDTSQNPSEGGSYSRDPLTGALVKTGGTAPAPIKDKRDEPSAPVSALAARAKALTTKE